MVFMKARSPSRELLLPHLSFLMAMGIPVASATTAEPQTVAPTLAPSLSDAADESLEFLMVAIVCAVVVMVVCTTVAMVSIGIVSICRIARNDRARDVAGDEEGGEGGSRRQSSSAMASFAGPGDLLAAAEEGKVREDGAWRTANPLYANSAFSVGGSSDSHSTSAKCDSTSSEHTPVEAGGGGIRDACNKSIDSAPPAILSSRSNVPKVRKQKDVPQLSIESSSSSNDGDQGNGNVVVTRTSPSPTSNIALTAPASAPATALDPDQAPLDAAAVILAARPSSQSLATPCQDTVPRFTKRPSLDTEKIVEEHQTATRNAESVEQRHPIDVGIPSADVGHDYARRPQVVSRGSVSSAAEDIVRRTEYLFRHSSVPGVKEVAALMAGLARLAAAHHRGYTMEMEERVARCQSVVRTLERACGVLAKSASPRGEGQRILFEDVQDSIRDMADTMKTYKPKYIVAEVLASSLCRRRQDEAEEAIAAAETYLEVFESSPQLAISLVSPKHTLRPISTEMAGDVWDQIKVLQDMLEKSIRKRKQRDVDMLDIPSIEVDVMDNEILDIEGDRVLHQ